MVASAPADARHPEVPGYELESVISQQRDTTVYAARRESDGRRVVVKLIDRRTENPRALQRFTQEIELGRRLLHRCIVPVIEHGSTSESVWFSMELLEGRTLRAAIRDPRLSLERRLRTVIEVAHALHEAHALGVIHRDVKPSHVFLTNDGHVRLLDFGISKLNGIDLTDVGTRNGTPLYMAPEQVRGDPVDGRTDVYALALTTYELMTGGMPWEAQTPYEAMAASCSSEPRPLARSLHGRPGKPLPLDFVSMLHACVHRGLSRNPDERQPTAGVFADELNAVLEASRAHRASATLMTRTYLLTAVTAASVAVGFVVGRMVMTP